MVDQKLRIQTPTQGRKQLLTGRQKILDAYDRAREQARAHEVETYHGKVAEAEFRGTGCRASYRSGMRSLVVISCRRDSAATTRFPTLM